MKKLFAILSCVAAISTLCLFSGCSGEAKVLYSLNEDGTYTVSGVSGNKDKLEKYEIPATYSEDGVNYAPVTKIGERAFYGCSYLSEVVIPDSVTYIDNLAFTLCAFEEIAIPDSVTEISWSAFAMCSQLKEITIPESVEKIGTKAFYGCSKLEKVVIKAPITNILMDTFSNSYAAGTQAYTNTSMTKIYLPASIEKIHYKAFDGNFFISEIYFEGTEEQWNKIKFYKTVKNESVAEGYEEVACTFAETFVSNPQVYWNCTF